jgi:hypothetical protein
MTMMMIGGVAVVIDRKVAKDANAQDHHVDAIQLLGKGHVRVTIETDATIATVHQREGSRHAVAMIDVAVVVVVIRKYLTSRWLEMCMMVV